MTTHTSGTDATRTDTGAPDAAADASWPQADTPSATYSPTDERTWGMLSHLGALIVLFVTGFLGFVVPLVVLATQGERSGFVRRHAAASLNFQLTLLVVGVVGSVAAVLGTILTLGLGLLVIVPAVLAYVVFALVVMIKASLRANQGEEYEYPLCIRFVR